MRNIRSIKLWICVACLACSSAAPSYQNSGISMDLIDLAAISRMSPQQLEVLAEGLAAQEIMRTKRSSAQALAGVASKASSSILQNKVGLLGQASAGAVSFISSASSKSGHHDEHPGYSYEPHGHDDKVDFWGLKKSILYTLFQAVKAITGGVTILKGQLIKGGGHLATTLGKVIAVKGESVSNVGKKIVNSAALSSKKTHHHSKPVYGPPPSHLDYSPPSSYGVPSAPAHAYSAPSAPSGYAAHKYPSHFDGATIYESIPLDFGHIGRGGGKLNGVHAGLVILTPLGEENADNYHASSSDVAHSDHTPLEPPPSLLHSAFSAIRNVLSGGNASPSYGSPTPTAAAAPTGPGGPEVIEHPPPPAYNSISWGAVNSYGEPAAADILPSYPPSAPSSHSQFERYSGAKSYSSHSNVKHGLTPDRLQKITANLDKIAHLTASHRSSEELPHFDGLDVYRNMLMKGAKIPLLPTPVVTDAEIGVLPAEVLPSAPSSAEPSTTKPLPLSPTSTASSTTTTASKDDKTRRKKDVKYFLRGNKIVLV